MGDNKEEILKWLKQLGRMPTSRFVGLLGLNYDVVKNLLNELKNEKKIKEEAETNTTYWRLAE